MSLGILMLLAIGFVTLFAKQLLPYDPVAIDPTSALRPPSSDHWMGTDRFGRDCLSRVLLGAQVTLRISLMVVVLSFMLGVPLGLLSGYQRGITDLLVSRMVEIIMAFPPIILAMGIIAVLGVGEPQLVVALSLRGMVRYVRVVRGCTMSVKEQPFVEAARSVGASTRRILLMHVLPNITAPLIVVSTLHLGAAMLSVASLGFLGLGVQPPQPEWGQLLSDAREYMAAAWWLAAFPGLCIALTVLSMNLVGDGLRDLTDPRLRGAE